MRSSGLRMTWSERLGALDAMFLYIEDRTAHMHVGAVAVFEGRAPPYRDLVALIGSKLDRAPRYRQRLAFGPFDLGRPVWIDDANLDLEFHVRHTALPPPGGEEQLKKLAGRVFAQNVNQGGNAAFSVTATGTSPLSYQWRFNGASIGGATASSYTRSNVQTGDAGSYSVIVTNVAGTVTSSNAVLTVNVPSPATV